MEKPYSVACERNQQPIAEQIVPLLANATSLLEIGSGTGQHAVYFASLLSHLSWQTSDVVENHAGINAWINDYKGNNLKAPIALNVLSDQWPKNTFDAAFSANTAHIMPWKAVVATFKRLQKVLNAESYYCLYGPFNYKGKFTSDSNARFNEWLYSQAPHQAIRDFESVEELANSCDFTLQQDIEMPANNRLLVWKKQ